jgi:hypothetical protein
MMAGWIPMTLAEASGRRANERRCGESGTKCVGEPFSFHAQDSYGSSRGFFRGYAAVGGGCSPCVGASLLVSHKCHSMIS